MDSKVNECHGCSVEHDDPVLDREIEIARKLQDWCCDGLVGELLKYGCYTCYTSFSRWFGVKS